MGSLEKKTHASLQKKVLKFKAWLSSNLFQKHFPIHYNEISIALPLPEYIDPVSGLLNVGLKLPKDLPKPDLGPSIYFSYGGPEELMQADYLSKLCYESHDTVGVGQIHIEYPCIASLYTNALGEISVLVPNVYFFLDLVPLLYSLSKFVFCSHVWSHR